MPLLSPPAVPQYRILEQVSQGRGTECTGTVYKAIFDGQVVAIKETTVERARREARILSRLDHPSIPTYFGYFEELPQRGCLVMEFLQGENLSQYLDRYLEAGA